MPKNPNDLGTRLREAFDQLIDAARQVARPSWIWIAGILYPGFDLSLDLVNQGETLEALNSLPSGSAPISLDGLSEDLRGSEEELMVLGGILLGSCLSLSLVVGLALIASRLSAGLAACASPETWRQIGGDTTPPGLRSAWEAGQGMTWSALGIWVLLLLMRLVALLVIGLPVLLFQGLLPEGTSAGLGILLGIVYLPLAGILIIYFIVLAALHQLALHSLVQNRRGMTSAIQHAWRLFRVDASISLSCLLVEASCLLVFALAGTAAGFVSILFCCLIVLVLPLTLAALKGFQGVLRAAFWARAYRDMGGATAADTLGGIGTSASQS